MIQDKAYLKMICILTTINCYNSGKSNNKEGLGWEINRWKQYFIDKRNTVDMDGLGW